MKFLWSKAENKKDNPEAPTNNTTTEQQATPPVDDKVNAELDDLKKEIETLNEKNNDLLVNTLE